MDKALWRQGPLSLSQCVNQALPPLFRQKAASCQNLVSPFTPLVAAKPRPSTQARLASTGLPASLLCHDHLYGKSSRDISTAKV